MDLEKNSNPVHFVIKLRQFDSVFDFINIMSAIFHRLKSPPFSFSSTESTPAFLAICHRDEMLQEQSTNHLILADEYNALCTQICAAADEARTLTRRKLAEALLLAEFLRIIYLDYLCVPHLAKRYHDDCEKLKVFLYTNYTPLPFNQNQSVGISEFIREHTSNWNLLRLFSLRLRRVLLASPPFLDSMPTVKHRLHVFEAYTNQIVAIQGWLYFTPRLINNFFVLLKHTCPRPWMEKQERDLGLKKRWLLQLQRKGFDWGNDLVWVGMGILNCFYLAGISSTNAFYISLCLQAYDVFLAGLRWYIERKRIKELISTYQDLFRNSSDPAIRGEITDHIKILKAKMILDEKRYILSLINTILLVLGVTLTAPALVAISPLFPLAGAVITLGTTGLAYYVTECLDELEPGIPDLEKLKSCIPNPEKLDLQDPSLNPSNPCLSELGMFRHQASSSQQPGLENNYSP
jgi:hypothetical protein